MGVQIGHIFDSAMKNSLFKDKSILQTSYKPETIPHRDKQIEQVASILAPLLRGERVSNLFVYGKTGTGKTLSVQYVCDEILKRTKEAGVNVQVIYINCKLKKVADTEYRILAALIDKLGDKVADTGLPTPAVYQKFIELVDKTKQTIVVIFDEIDQVVKKIDDDDFLYNLTRINSELSKAQTSIIGISNDVTFLENIDPRVKSSLGEEEIIFSPYNAMQLKDILDERSKIAFKESVVDEAVISKCAAFAAREHGDARRALDLLRIAGELAERDGKERINEDYIDQANQKIEKDKILDIVETSTKQFQAVLYSILKLNKENKDVDNSLFTGDIFNLYNDVCKEIKMEVLTQRRVSDIIGEIDMFGLINAKVISKGRHGRTREVKLSIPSNLLEKVDAILIESLGI
ncbi:ORC1-type DNA replication protein [uncultured archaeon]|nr:ORC1-type DNA replication protein [uncultured archaeon]